MRASLVLLLAVWGCDAVFRLSPVPSPPDAMDDAAIATGWKATASGYAHTCGIRADDTLWCWGSNEYSEVGVGSSQGIVETPTRVGTGLYTSVTATHQHTCALALDDTLWCWGFNEYSQLGTGNNITGEVPVQVDGTWKRVATGGWQTCGIKNDDTLWCWGWNNWGELGLGSTTRAPVPTQVGTSTWLDIDPGWYQTCGIQSDRSMWCWGDNSLGALGNGTKTNSTVPVPGPPGMWERVDVAVHVACGIQLSGELRCWGNGARGLRGDGSLDAMSTPQPVLIGGNDLDDWAELSIDHTTACATRDDGSLWCWGTDGRDQLGIPGIEAYADRPVQRIAPAATWRRVDTGVIHTCAIDVDNQLWCNGGAGRGQLANGATSHPTPVKMPATLGKLRLGTSSTCGLDPGGRIACSGSNGRGQLGDGTIEPRQLLVPMAANLTEVSVVAPGTIHTCALSGTTTVCWGGNTHGALGNATTTDSFTPVVAGGALPKLASRSHTCGIDAASNLYCWGLNSYGQVGNGTYVNQTSPALVGGGSDVSVGAYHSCVITTAATQSAYCWGRNVEGQIGNGTVTTATPSPVSVAQGTSGQLVAIRAGGFHTCAISVTGRLWCWGGNARGQLGLGDAVQRVVPTAVGTASWTSLASGAYHTCGVQADGTLWCWGKGDRGQLGLGNYVDRFVPARVGTDTDWLTVDAGDEHTCATKAGDELWCWGSNDHGELPDGTSWADTPVLVP